MYKCYWCKSEEVERVSKNTDNYIAYVCQKCGEQVDCWKEDYDESIDDIKPDTPIINDY